MKDHNGKALMAKYKSDMYTVGTYDYRTHKVLLILPIEEGSGMSYCNPKPVNINDVEFILE